MDRSQPKFFFRTCAPGDYTYQTTFSLAGFISSSAIIQGNFAVDNEVESITLNGVSVPLSFHGNLLTLTDFTISSGFMSGVNTLDFTVVNLESEPTPTGITGSLHERHGNSRSRADLLVPRGHRLLRCELRLHRLCRSQ